MTICVQFGLFNNLAKRSHEHNKNKKKVSNLTIWSLKQEIEKLKIKYGIRISTLKTVLSCLIGGRTK